jgi:hypothetical protein
MTIFEVDHPLHPFSFSFLCSCPYQLLSYHVQLDNQAQPPSAFHRTKQLVLVSPHKTISTDFTTQNK